MNQKMKSQPSLKASKNDALIASRLPASFPFAAALRVIKGACVFLEKKGEEGPETERDSGD